MYGVPLALASAVLFGAAIPAAKTLLVDLTAFQLAGLLYLGGAMGIAPRALWRREPRPPLDTVNRVRLGGAVVLGGIAGPVLLLLGLLLMSAGSVSLFLNFEVAATALLGTLLFGETLGPRGWAGVGGVIAASTVLSWTDGWPGVISALLVVAACMCWGCDNNFTALIDGMSPSETTLWKTAIAGTANVLIGFGLEPFRASASVIVAALGVGALCYGVSITLYITAAHAEGATRSQAIFAIAPFVGTILSWTLLHEPVQGAQILAGAGFVVAVALLASDAHIHSHAHQALGHIHSHRHDDDHHGHAHPDLPPAVRHTHWHEHAATEHTHRHVADLHHRHRGGE